MFSLEQILLLLFTTIVFPGIVFIIALALFTEWYIRKAVAHMQSRVGPRYVGPFGLLQPLADLLKLASVKEEVKQKYSSLATAKFFGLLGIGALTASLLLFPLSPLRIVSEYDFLVYMYLFGVWVPLSIIIMSLSTPNPYTNIGVSRLLCFTIIVEPAYFSALLVPVTLASYNGGSPPYSIYGTAEAVYRLWSNPLYALLLAIAFIAVVVSIQAKTMLNPFNIPEAEQEIIAGFATEFSGPVLAVYNLLHDIEVSVAVLSIVYLFLGGPAPYNHLSIPGIVVLVVKYIVVATLVSVIRASYGRFRIEQGLATLTKYSLLLGVIAALAANIIVLL